MRLLSRPDSPPPQAVLEIRIQGSGLSIHGPSLWTVPSSPHFYKVHVCGYFPAETAGNPHLVPLSMVCRRKVVLTDASSLGWGALCDGKSAFGPWSKKEGYLHINCLEMLAVWSGLRTFLPDLRGHHVLIRSDSMTVVFYINLQGGLASRHLFILAECLLSRVGYRNPVPMWHRYLCNRYVPTRIKTQISVPHFGAMPNRSVEIFVLCFSETDVRSIITGTKCAK